MALALELEEKRWLSVIFLTLLLHLLFFVIPWDVFIWRHGAYNLSPRIKVEQVDPAKLEAVRQKWRQRQILLNKDQSRPSEKEAPKDAKFISDVNRRVKKQTRARQAQVMPKKTPGVTLPATPRPKPTQGRRSSFKRSLPNLGTLGVPLNLNRRTTRTMRNKTREEPMPMPQQGGSQSIYDRSIPLGAENMLNSAESVFYSFYARLYESVGPLWESRVKEIARRRSFQPGDYITQVEVIFDKNGNLIDIRYIKSSSIRELDNAVDYAWRKIDRYPNPPKGLFSEDGYVHTSWSFNFHISNDFQFLYRPPKRER